jgi:hypothetical protein
MSASLSDILTALKNGVVAINGLNSEFTTFTNNVGAPTLLTRASATTSYATVYTCPAGVVTYVTDINICNTTGAAITAYVSLVASGGTAGASNAIFYNTNIPAYSTMQWTGSQVLGSGGTIQVYSSSTGCTISISGGVS